MQKQKLITGILVIAIIAGLTAGTIYYTNSQNLAQQSEQVQSTMGDRASLSPEDFLAYADGEYMSVGSYTSPGGGESIDVTITLENNIVTDAEVVANAQLPISKNYQDTFIENYQDMVIGKDINEIELDVVSGSSLTPIGFNNALNDIREQAIQEN